MKTIAKQTRKNVWRKKKKLEASDWVALGILTFLVLDITVKVLQWKLS